MKTKIVIAFFMLVAFSASAAPKIVTKHFDFADSIRIFEKDDPQAQGYKFNKMVSIDWPVTINGKSSTALNDFLVEEVFYASYNPGSFPTTPRNFDALCQCVRSWVSGNLRTNTMVQEYTIKEYGTSGLQDIDSDEDYMSCWFETTDLKVSHTVGNLVFFVENGSCYYGGAHDVFAATFLAFDAALDKPIRLADIISNPRKLRQILPKYDHRDEDCKWWDNIEVTDIDNFFIKDGKMVFVFQPYAIGPFSDGIVEVPISLKTLRAKKLLTPYGKKLLK